MAYLLVDILDHIREIRLDISFDPCHTAQDDFELIYLCKLLYQRSHSSIQEPPLDTPPFRDGFRQTPLCRITFIDDVEERYRDLLFLGDDTLCTLPCVRA